MPMGAGLQGQRVQLAAHTPIQCLIHHLMLLNVFGKGRADNHRNMIAITAQSSMVIWVRKGFFNQHFNFMGLHRHSDTSFG